MKTILQFFLCLVTIVACNNSSVSNNNESITEHSATNNIATIKPQIEVVAQYSHNIKYFTEGLEFKDSILLESTGQFGESFLMKLNVQTGKELQKITLDKKFFGEGITCINNKLFMVTYQTEKGFIFDYNTLKKISEFSYKGEGWGMTNDGKQIIMSNGSDKLSFRNANTFAEEKTLPITYNNQPISNINELEFVDGYIYANIFQTNKIIKINASTGIVENIYDFESIENQARTINPSIDVLNGIAYNKKSKSFFITGKFWPTLYEVKLN